MVGLAGVVQGQLVESEVAFEDLDLHGGGCFDVDPDVVRLAALELVVAAGEVLDADAGAER